jgi:uncharacterized protein (TIGR02996 family)
MDMEQALLQAIQECPDEEASWLVLADWLEDQGDARAEVLRLTRALRLDLDEDERRPAERRLQELLLGGVRPCVPRLTNSLGMQLALVPPGSFWMGSDDAEAGRFANEGPRHRVTLTRAFFLGVYPVRQAEWRAVMDGNPSHRQADDHPVENVSWNDCQDFCQRLSRKEGRLYRLPSEAEWEYACRAGTSTAYWSGDDLPALKKAAWSSYDGIRCSAGGTRPVGQFAPNPFGLYDVHGNVLELCHDRLGKYPAAPATDPRGGPRGRSRVLRGGGWHNEPCYCRSACRLGIGAASANACVGFRVCLDAY